MVRTIFLLSLFLLFSCTSSELHDDVSPSLKSFSVYVNGKWVDAEINDDKSLIDLSSVTDYNKISEVKYELSDNSTILPLPESMIGKWSTDNNFVVSCGQEKKIYVLTFGDDSEDNSHNSNSLPDPGKLVGVHWKTYTTPVFDENGKIVSASVDAKPIGLTDYEKVAYYATTGANCIALKIEDGRQLCMDLVDEDNFNDDLEIEQEGLKIWQSLEDKEQQILLSACSIGCSKFIKAVYEWNNNNPDKTIYVMLFKRTWFQREGKKIEGNMESIASDFANVINICKEGGYDSPIIGVHAVENRINNIDELIPYCLDFADVINNKTNDWLKSKIYFFAGLGMGISFKGYDDFRKVKGIDIAKGSDTFWNDIKSKCAGFTWVYKRFPEYNVEPLLKEYMDKYDNYGTTYDEQVERMLDLYGHRDLKRFVDSCTDEMFNNVLFWGDSADGMKHIQPSSEKDALKTIWLSYNFKSGLFYHFFNKTASFDSEWKNQNNIMCLNNGILSKNSAYNNWEKFFDGSYLSTYGSTGELKKIN